METLYYLTTIKKVLQRHTLVSYAESTYCDKFFTWLNCKKKKIQTAEVKRK